MISKLQGAFGAGIARLGGRRKWKEYGLRRDTEGAVVIMVIFTARTRTARKDLRLQRVGFQCGKQKHSRTGITRFQDTAVKNAF